MLPLECAQHLEERVKALSYDERSSIPREHPAIIEQLRHDADVLKTMLRATHSRLNALMPVIRLPAELIAEVFAILADAEPPLITHATRSLGWVRLSHVCQRWRAVCLAQPLLWARSVGTLPRALSTFLERAGERVALHYHLPEGWSKDGNNLPNDAPSLIELKTRSSRVNTLAWSADSEEEASLIVHTLYSYTFDALEGLHVYSRTETWNVSDPAFLLRANSLRTLQLDGFLLNFSAPQLTSLALRNVNCNARIALWISLDCPLLTSLHLENLDSGNFLDEHEALPVLVRLAHLQVLRLDWPILGEDMTLFLERLEVPKTAYIHIRRARMQETIDYALLTRLFMMTTVGEEETFLQFLADSVTLDTRRSQGSPWHNKWSVQVDDEMFLLAESLPRISADHYLKRVTHLKILPFRYSDADIWEDVFHLMSGVHSLEVANLDRERGTLLPLPDVFVALSRCFDERDQPLIQAPLPKLSRIVVCRDVPSKTVYLENTVLESLRIRAFANVRPIRALYLESFDESEEDATTVQALRALVQTVVWKAS